MNVKHNLRGSFLVVQDNGDVLEAVRLVSYWGPQKTITLGGIVMQNGTIVRRLAPSDEGYLPQRERMLLSEEPLHDLPDVGKYVLPREEAAVLISNDNYEG